MKRYFQPIINNDTKGAFRLAQGWRYFDALRVKTRGGTDEIIQASDAPGDVLAALTGPRLMPSGLDLSMPNIMGILNVTPDSFSDGGEFHDYTAARKQAGLMIRAGADILDIGGESTRPGADFVPAEREIARVVPVIAAMQNQISVPISIDTRKAKVADAAISAGASILNDVSALGFDDDMVAVAAQGDFPVCIMHAKGDPKTMQDAPSYDDVLLDIYDYLSDRIDFAVENGIARDRLIVDPGIGFGKTLEHNLHLIRNLSIFHALGLPVLLGASRKRFIGTISGAEAAQDRMAGSIAVALEGLVQGVQITRVHDVAETRQAFDLWQAINAG